MGRKQMHIGTPRKFDGKTYYFSGDYWDLKEAKTEARRARLWGGWYVRIVKVKGRKPPYVRWTRRRPSKYLKSLE